jgi:hypothetical protein
LPFLAGARPLLAEPVQPVFVVLPQALKAPVRGGLVEHLPRPFDHDQRSVVSQSHRQSFDHRGGIGYVKKRCGGDHGVDSLRKLEVLELDAVVVGGIRRVRVAAGRLVAVRVQKRDEAAEWTAAEIEHGAGGAGRRARTSGQSVASQRSPGFIARSYGDAAPLIFND